MAIKPGYKQFTFDGKNSGDYGVYITGSAVYNSPKRDVELIEIPGRNGAFVLDNGRFENIEVTYPAGIYAESQEDFAQAVSDLRNMLSSRKGYCRLTDEYNPEEYRMAVYKSGLDVDPVAFQRAGEFSITFDCKPQRWLTSGETAVTVTSGDTLTNPTLFESSPLLKATGYGMIEFNDYEIDFDGVPYGETVICPDASASSSSNPCTLSVPLDTSLLNAGDAIYPETKGFRISANFFLTNVSYKFTSASVASTTNVLDARANINAKKTGLYCYLWPDFGNGFAYGTAETITCSATYNYAVDGGTASTEQVQVTIAYDGADTISVTITRTGTVDAKAQRGSSGISNGLNPATIYGDSSQIITDPIFIDCDLGEAYIVENGVYRSLNQYIDLGSELPKLASGSNTVTFDNTITELNITPRWWKV